MKAVFKVLVELLDGVGGRLPKFLSNGVSNAWSLCVKAGAMGEKGSESERNRERGQIKHVYNTSSPEPVVMDSATSTFSIA